MFLFKKKNNSTTWSGRNINFTQKAKTVDHNVLKFQQPKGMTRAVEEKNLNCKDLFRKKPINNSNSWLGWKVDSVDTAIGFRALDCFDEFIP